MRLCKVFLLTLAVSLCNTGFPGFVSCEEKTGSMQDLFQKAESAISKQEYSRAEVIFRSFLNDPDQDIKRGALYGLARVYYFRNDYRKARENLNLALQIDPQASRLQKDELAQTLAGIRVYLAYINMHDGAYQKAVEELQKAEKAGLAESSGGRFLGSNIYLLMAKNYLRLGSVETAKQFFKKSYELKMPEGVDAERIKQASLSGLGNCSLLLGEYTQAVSYFKEAIQKSKRNDNFRILAYIGCSNAYLFSGEFDKAAEECSGQLQSVPEGIIRNEAFYTVAMIKLKQNDLKGAEDYLNKMWEHISGAGSAVRRANYSFDWDFYSALAQYSLGVVHLSGKEFGKASAELNKALELIDKGRSANREETTVAKYLRISATYSLYEILSAQGETEAAAKTFFKADQLIKRLTPKQRAIVEKKRFSMYVEGKSLQSFLKK